MPDSGKDNGAFNLEKALEEWCRRMIAGGLKDRDVLDELESHLRDDTEQRARQGLSVEAAFEAAVQALGQTHALEQEFAKLRQPSRKFSAALLCIRLCCWGSAGFVGALGGWGLAQGAVSPLSALRFAAALLALLYFLKLPFLYQRLPAMSSPTARECLRFLTILAWPSWVYSVAAAGTTLHLVLLAFGSIIPALALAASFRLDGESRSPLFLGVIPGNLDEATQSSLKAAQLEAARLRHDFVGTEHLLLALLREQGNAIAKVMNSRGITAEALAAAIEKEICTGQARPASQVLPHTPRANRALKLAAGEARAANRHSITPEHLFLGLLLEGDGIAARVLVRLGVEANQVRREIQQQL